MSGGLVEGSIGSLCRLVVAAEAMARLCDDMYDTCELALQLTSSILASSAPECVL